MRVSGGYLRLRASRTPGVPVTRMRQGMRSDGDKNLESGQPASKKKYYSIGQTLGVGWEKVGQCVKWGVSYEDPAPLCNHATRFLWNFARTLADIRLKK